MGNSEEMQLQYFLTLNNCKMSVCFILKKTEQTLIKAMLQMPTYNYHFHSWDWSDHQRLLNFRILTGL